MTTPEGPGAGPTERELAQRFEDSPLVKMRRLDLELSAARRWSATATRQLHAVMLADLRQAEARARHAERRAADAEQRVTKIRRQSRRAAAEVARIKQSSTWRAGRVVVWLPARIKRWRRA